MSIAKLTLLSTISLLLGLTDAIAGPLPGSAEDLTNAPVQTSIAGDLAYPYGVDMYRIDITNYLDFSAETIPVGAFSVPDTELFLFNSSGLGIYENDDISGGDTLSCLPSAAANNPCPSSRNGVGPMSDGIYYLAVTRSANMPLSDAGYIFSPISSTDVVGPDLMQGGASPVTGWDNGVYTQPDFDLVAYDIAVTGVVPEPSTWLLIATACIGLILFRKKLATR